MTARAEGLRRPSHPATPREKSALLTNLPFEPKMLQDHINGLVREVHIEYGHGIRQPLDPVDTCYVVRNGEVKVTDGRKEREGRYGPGDYFGAEALSGNIDHRYHSFTIVVSPEGADLLTIHASEVARLRRLMQPPAHTARPEAQKQEVTAILLQHAERRLREKGRPDLARKAEEIRLELNGATPEGESRVVINNLIPEYSPRVQELLERFADTEISDDPDLSIRIQNSLIRHFRPKGQGRKNPVKLNELAKLHRNDLPSIWNFGQGSAAELGARLETLLGLEQIEGYIAGSLPHFLQEPWRPKTGKKS